MLLLKQQLSTCATMEQTEEESQQAMPLGKLSPGTGDGVEIHVEEFKQQPASARSPSHLRRPSQLKLGRASGHLQSPASSPDRSPLSPLSPFLTPAQLLQTLHQQTGKKSPQLLASSPSRLTQALGQPSQLQRSSTGSELRRFSPSAAVIPPTALPATAAHRASSGLLDEDDGLTADTSAAVCAPAPGFDLDSPSLASHL